MKEQTIKEQLVNADTRITGVTQPVNRTEQNLTKIRGLLTSNLRSRTSSNTPYMAFFRIDALDTFVHDLKECGKQKCQECEIPVVFRIKDWDNSRLFGEDH